MVDLKNVLFKGGVGGIVMAVIFLTISGMTYYLLSLTALDIFPAVLISIISGPAIGIAGAFIVWLTISSRLKAQTEEDNETTPGHES